MSDDLNSPYNAPQADDFQQVVETDPDSRFWAMLTHLSAMSVFLTGVGFLLGPVIVWLIKRDQYVFVDEHGKESVNFQLSMMFYHLGLIAISLATCGVGMIVTVPLMIVLFIVDLVLVVIASIAANNGQWYRYPITIRLIK